MDKRNQVTPLGWVAVIALMTFVAALVGATAALYTRSLQGFVIGGLAMFGLMLVGVVATIVVPQPDPETTKLPRALTPDQLRRQLRIRSVAASVAGFVVCELLRLAGVPYRVAVDAGTLVGLTGMGSILFGLLRAARAKQAVEARTAAAAAEPATAHPR